MELVCVSVYEKEKKKSMCLCVYALLAFSFWGGGECVY